MGEECVFDLGPPRVAQVLADVGQQIALDSFRLLLCERAQHLHSGRQPASGVPLEAQSSTAATIRHVNKELLLG